MEISYVEGESGTYFIMRIDFFRSWILNKLRKVLDEKKSTLESWCYGKYYENSLVYVEKKKIFWGLQSAEG